MDFVRSEMSRRHPGQSDLTTARNEADEVEILSGIYEGKTTGTPIGFIIRNQNQRSADYDEMKDVFRPSHADFTYQMKYGIRDPRGGGRSSARETAVRVFGGAIAKLLLHRYNIDIQGYTSQIGSISLEGSYPDYDLRLTETNAVRCPDAAKAAEMEALIRQVKDEGDSVGGVVSCVIRGVPPGLGEPVFGKLQAALGAAMLSINAVKGFDYGDGFAAPLYRGSEHNDGFTARNDANDTHINQDIPALRTTDITTTSNYSGGIQGGISNGQDIYFRVAFKATATIMRDQQTVDIHGKETIFKARGRHDPCVIPRAVPVVEAMAAMTIADHLLLSQK